MKLKLLLACGVLAFLVVALILGPIRDSRNEQTKLNALDERSMKEIAFAIKHYVRIMHKNPSNDNANFISELNQSGFLTPSNDSVLILNGIIYDPWTKPYRFVLSEHSMKIESCKQHYEESF